MGITRYDDLPENQAAAAVREATQAAQERKAMQRFGGSNLRYYRTDSPGAWLWSGQLDFESGQSAGTGMARFIIYFTSSTSDTFLSSISVVVEGSSDGITWSPQPWKSSSGGNYDWTVQDGSAFSAQPFKIIYDIIMRGPYMAYRRFKVQALTSAPVTISFVRSY